MAKVAKGVTGLAIVLAAGAVSAQPVLGADAAVCAGGGPAALVRVHGFKDRAGNLRVQLYTDREADFLEKGRKLRRVELPVTAAEPMHVCVALPSPGRYTLAVLHDRDANGKLSLSSDGVGFSNNPRLGLGKPDVTRVTFAATAGVTRLSVILNYRQGLLSVRPLHEG